MIKENIQILCTQLLESKHDRIGAPEARDAEQWSAPRNMAKWSKCDAEFAAEDDDWELTFFSL